MGEQLIYWKKFDEPKKVFDPIKKIDVEMCGQWECKDERVEHAWVTVGLHPTNMDDKHLQYRLDILLKNGERKTFTTKAFHIDDPKGHDLDPLINEGEEYLKSIV